jgi:hypothetical protein
VRTRYGACVLPLIGFEKPKLQAVIERAAQFSVSPDVKDWVIQLLVHPLQQRELDQLIAALENDGYQVGDADELNGTYKGAVLLKTTYFLADWTTRPSRP